MYVPFHLCYDFLLFGILRLKDNSSTQAIEVRTPPSGVKAQWVRIELRKVETLPGGGDTNKFYDYVGPSPVTLWTAPDEYNILRTVSPTFNSTHLFLAMFR